MTGDWFDRDAEQIAQRIRSTTSRLEFIAGVRVNGVPHVGTYLVLASAFIVAARAASRFGLPSSVHIHFLDNDPVPCDAAYSKTHFHCVFQTRTTEESAAFVRENYLDFLDELSAQTGCFYDPELYSIAQAQPAFRTAVLQSLRAWRDIKYYISGQPVMDAPMGVRGLGFPCPRCGLFNGRMRPSIDWTGEDEVIVTTDCCEHGTYSTTLSPGSKTYLNLETAFRNVIKERLAAGRSDCVSIMVKGLDWERFLANLDLIHGILGLPPGDIPLRFLLPLAATESGVKFSKSAIQKFPQAFAGVPFLLLNMNALRGKFKDCASRILAMAEQVLGDPSFASRPVFPAEVLRMLRIK